MHHLISIDQHLSRGIIPESVTHLEFGYKFNQPLTQGVVPRSVIDIYHWGNFDLNTIPNTVVTFNNKPYGTPN